MAVGNNYTHSQTSEENQPQQFRGYNMTTN